jgi:predicted ATPase
VSQGGNEPPIINKSNYFILTGMSGTGKTTLLQSLNRRGSRCYEEPIRALLTHQLETDGPALPSKDTTLFVKEMLKRSIHDYEEAESSDGNVYFDRGIPDVIAYAIRFGVDSAPIEIATKKYGYNKSVFLLPPWEEIFINDTIRGKSYHEYLEFHEIIRNTYISFGYSIVDVPKIDIEARTDFVISQSNIIHLE